MFRNANIRTEKLRLSVLRLTVTACLVLSLQWTTAEAAFVNIYSIGNSLTVDLAAGPLEALTASDPNPFQVGYHVKCGENLQSIIADPSVFCLPTLRFGQYPTALSTTQFDAITIQPSGGSMTTPTTVRQELIAARQIINDLRANPNNSNTRVLIYATWSENSTGSTFANTWKSTGANLDSPFVQTEEIYDLFMNELRITTPEAEIIPVGHVYYDLISKIDQGMLPGIASINDFYRDVIHASSAGRYTAAVTAYATLLNKSPEGLGYPDFFTNPAFSVGPFMTDASARSIAQATAWETVQRFSTIPEPFGSMAMVLIFGSSTVFRRTRRIEVC